MPSKSLSRYWDYHGSAKSDNAIALRRDLIIDFDSGVIMTSVETVLFELLKVAEGEQFKEILKIVK